MRNLPERDKKIIKMHFGIGEKYSSPCTLSEIADRTKLTKERVRQIIIDTQKAMKEMYENNVNKILNY